MVTFLALRKLILAFTQGQIVTLGETHEHEDVFFYHAPGPDLACMDLV